MNNNPIMKERIANNISIVLIGIIITRIISFIGTSIIVRMLEPHNYGLLNISFALPYIFTLISDLGLSAAIIRYTAKFKHNNNLTDLKASIKIVIIFSFCFSLMNTSILFLLSHQISLFLFDSYDYSMLLKIASIGVFANITYNITISILNGLEKMKNVSFSMILQAIIRSTASPILIIYLGLVGAMIGFIIAPLFVGITNLIVIYKFYKKFDNKYKCFYRSLLKEMIIFGVPILLSISIEPLTFQIYNILLIQYVQISDIGNFNVVLIFSSIISILINPFDKSLYPAFSKEKISDTNISTYNEIYNTFMKHMSLLITPIIAIIPIYSTLIITLIFGKSYYTASIYLSYYMLYFIGISFGKIVLHSFLKGQGHSIVSASISTLTVIISIIISLVAVPLIGIIAVYLSLSFASLLMTVLGHLWVNKKYKFKINIKIIIKINIIVLIDYIITILLSNLISLSYIKYVIILLLFFFIYSILLMVFNVLNEKDLYEIKILYGEIFLIKQIITIVIKIELFLLKKIKSQR